MPTKEKFCKRHDIFKYSELTMYLNYLAQKKRAEENQGHVLVKVLKGLTVKWPA
jgi:hypothetical protein